MYKYININEYNTEYYDIGEGKTLLFLPGWNNSCRDVSFVANKLCDLRRCIVLSFPGFGNSQTPREAFDVSSYAAFTMDFLNAALERKSTDKPLHIDIIAHSFGGRVVLKLYKEQLEKQNIIVDNLILMGAAGIRKPLTFKGKCRQYFIKAVNFVFKCELIRKMYPYFQENLRNKYSSVDYRNARGIMKEIFKKVVNEDLINCVDLITSKTLLLWGSKDTATPLWFGDYYHVAIKESKLKVYEGGDHFFFANPKFMGEFIEDVREFLA
ncbi:MAG: alpha/beta hydrolase [Lachnospiraceae bacterium]|nr:alpha/beta hydrolase [Lachnospiraceae bacterium]